ncbi:hypothetical protein QFC20_002794 [Naganishia adeliensis]|uniref:Uncharacterized protein n=1 Tax=Naganishia adeliensis TaxID=92952 RepID=A0ACC2WG80_9TREE|nr:hypothetical protein QFC20_002794 [Naganishia adeliensis]
MDETDIPSHLRANREDYHYAQQAHSTQRAAEGVERVEPLNEPWQALQGHGQHQSHAFGQQYSSQQSNSYPQDHSTQSQGHLAYQYQGQGHDQHGQHQPQGYNQYSSPDQQGYQQPGYAQTGYNGDHHAQYQGQQGIPSNIPHSMSPPADPQYASHPYRHGQPPGAHMNSNGLTASHENTLHAKLQDMHIMPGSGKESNDPAEVTEQLAKANVDGSKTMVPPNPLQYPPLLRPMQPHLQLMVGPILAYSTVERNIWYGAALVVTYDSGSIYDPAPCLSLSFGPSKFSQQGGYYQPQQGQQSTHPMQVSGVPIYNYRGVKGTSTFWRFPLQLPLQPYEQTATYRLNQGQPIDFLIPAIGMNMRWAAHSCNGFSAGVDMDSFKGEGFESGYDPLWADLLKEHDLYGLHALVGGGDQIYCDSITQEPELQDWVTESSPAKKMQIPVTDEIKFAVDRYYFSHYVRLFRSSKFAVANGCIPMLNMLDDHDLIDGFGSYDDETQLSPIFNHIGSRGYFWFLLFQLFVCDEFDGTHHPPGSHPSKGLVIGGPGAYIPHPNHTLISYLGPNVYMVLLDCRAERKLDQVCSKQTYDLVFSLLERLPLEVEQIVMLLGAPFSLVSDLRSVTEPERLSDVTGVPIVYPRMHIAEHVLQTKLNPLNLLSRSSSISLGGFSNKFDKRPELLDDLNDHWCAKGHKHERNDLIKRLQDLALRNKYRITFLSGSAIVNTPPPMAPQLMVNQFATHKHRTLHYAHTDEIMYVIGRRNYAIARMDATTRDLIIDIRLEIVQGEGNTKP